MRVIVTGGTGLIGRALVENLAQAGHEVISISRKPRQYKPLPGNVTFESWDGRSSQGWGHLAEGAGAIVNLAAQPLTGHSFFPARWSAERKHNILQSRLNAGQAVVEAVKNASKKPTVVIQASAVGYYGAHKNEDIVEDTPPGNDFLANVCKQWEASTASVESMGVRRAVIRSGVVLSTEDGALPRLMFPFKLFAGGPLGSGKQQVSWIHMDDEVAAIRFLIENPNASGPFNLSAPDPLSNVQFERVLGKVMGRPAFFPMPGFAFKMLFGEVSKVLLEGQRAVPKKLLNLGFQFRFTKAEDALKDLLGNK